MHQKSFKYTQSAISNVRRFYSIGMNSLVVVCCKCASYHVLSNTVEQRVRSEMLLIMSRASCSRSVFGYDKCLIRAKRAINRADLCNDLSTRRITLSSFNTIWSCRPIYLNSVSTQHTCTLKPEIICTKPPYFIFNRALTNNNLLKRHLEHYLVLHSFL